MGAHWFFYVDLKATKVLALELISPPIPFLSLASGLSTLKGVIYIDILVWNGSKEFLHRMSPVSKSLPFSGIMVLKV